MIKRRAEWHNCELWSGQEDQREQMLLSKLWNEEFFQEDVETSLWGGDISVRADKGSREELSEPALRVL